MRGGCGAFTAIFIYAVYSIEELLELTYCVRTDALC